MFQHLNNQMIRLARLWLRRAGPLAYPVFAATLVLVVARWFYGEMHAQTGGEWSAPLDDVFIHFDFARATARGYPFQWSEGNGYSSGNTSVTYPFILALGYWVGFRGPLLMLWAAIVACSSVFIFLLVVPRLADGLPKAAHFFIPIALLSVGALNWSLFSGMEVAWFLALWALALNYALEHRRCPSHLRAWLGWRLGLAGALVVATRPEAATAVAVLGFTAAYFVWRFSHRITPTIRTTLRAGFPAVTLLFVQGVTNKLLTGDFAAAGALVKLAYYNPYMPAQDKWETYVFHLKYAVLRNIEYHFADAPIYGWIPIILAVIALLSRRTRASAVILLSSATLFMLLVATNGQVRWQNERYTMPAVAWLLVASSFGLGALLFRSPTYLPRLTWIPRGSIAIAAIALFAIHQAPKMKDQIWFFGRASRNIRDQHVTVGRLLRSELRPVPRRILVGDAGAILYASDLPGLDIIGLGGYRGLPIARSSVQGIGATVELMERIPPQDRPDVFALYPTWWGKFPLWFGRHITSVWVEGNVVCGGTEKAIYAADWRLLNTGARPASLKPGETIADELDIADILSERQHQYEFPKPQAGFVDLRILSDPVTPSLDVLDAGRRIPEGRAERFILSSPIRAPNMRLVVRAAPLQAGRVEVTCDAKPVGELVLEPVNGWVELSVELPIALQPHRPVEFTLTPRGVHEWINYHVWLIASP